MENDVVALGEVLIDFTQVGTSEAGYPVYETNPGGAPCNVLAAAVKLGHTGMIIGKVGQDSFGELLAATLDTKGIDTRGLKKTDDYFTTLAFVSLNEKGDRSFAFSRKHSADIMLNPDDVDADMLLSSRIFHCGTLSLASPSSREATLKALSIAKDNHLIVSVDPNLRENLWDSPASAKSAILEVLGYADIIKLSDYELSFLYPDWKRSGQHEHGEAARRGNEVPGGSDFRTAVEKILAAFLPKLLCVTCGIEGAHLFYGGRQYSSPCYLEVDTIDTTGAGDAFCGAILSCLLDCGLNLDSLTERQCADMLEFANAAASLSTTKRGGISSMPDKSEVLELMKTRSSREG